MLSAPMVLIHQFVLNLETLIQFAIVVVTFLHSPTAISKDLLLENTSTLKTYFKTTTFRSEMVVLQKAGEFCQPFTKI